MIYRKYRKLRDSNFSVLDGVKCRDTLSTLQFKHLFLLFFYTPCLATFFYSFFGSFISSDPSNNLVIVLVSYVVAFAISGRSCFKSSKKWRELIGEFEEMQHHRCLELNLPLFILKRKVRSGKYSTTTQFYATFLMPALFQEEFLTFRKNDTCRELVFEYKLDKKWISQNLKECFVEVIPKSEIEAYTFHGIKPFILIDE